MGVKELCTQSLIITGKRGGGGEGRKEGTPGEIGFDRLFSQK